MRFSLTLTISHPGLAKQIVHTDLIEARSKCAALKSLELTGKQICALKNKGTVTWVDANRATHKLELKLEVN